MGRKNGAVSDTLKLVIIVGHLKKNIFKQNKGIICSFLTESCQPVHVPLFTIHHLILNPKRNAIKCQCIVIDLSFNS